MPARQTRQFLGYARIRRRAERILSKEKAGGSSPPVDSKFNKTIPLHLLDDFLSQKCGKEMFFRRALYPNLVWQGLTSGTTFIGVGETVVGDQGPQWRPAGGRTGQDRGADIKGRTNQRSFRRSFSRRPGPAREHAWPNGH